MAAAIARGTYPDNGRFASAGREAAKAVDPALVAFMGEHGYDLSGARPTTLDVTHETLSRYFVIVTLEGPVKSYVGRVPFHCSVLEWDVGPAPDGFNGEEATRRYEELYRQISLHVRDLVETLRGEGAA